MLLQLTIDVPELNFYFSNPSHIKIEATSGDRKNEKIIRLLLLLL